MKSLDRRALLRLSGLASALGLAWGARRTGAQRTGTSPPGPTEPWTTRPIGPARSVERRSMHSIRPCF